MHCLPGKLTRSKRGLGNLKIIVQSWIFKLFCDATADANVDAILNAIVDAILDATADVIVNANAIATVIVDATVIADSNAAKKTWIT